MANDSGARLPRERFSDRIGQGGATPSGSDPLAELARLIGQTDPFATIGEAGSAPAPNTPPRRAAHPAPAQEAPVAAPPVVRSGRAMPRMGADPAISGQTAWPQPAALPGWMARRDGQHGEPATAPQAAPGDDDSAYDYSDAQTAPAHAPPTHAAPYVDSDYADDQEAYADPMARGAHDTREWRETDTDTPQEGGKTRGLAVVVMVAALAVVGTAGAYAYRSLIAGGVRNSGPPPVIKADTSPVKIVPPAQGGSETGKQIVDRVGGAASAERIVPREEQPVDVKDASKGGPRVVFPGAPPIQSGGQAASPPQLAPPPVASSQPVSAEPKKIKTIQIRADNSEAPAPVATSARAATPAPAAAQPRATTPPVQASRNAPISLSPQASAEPPQRTAALPQTSAGGSYHVQVSSQRSEGDAQASYRALQAKYASVLGGRSASIRRADLGEKGVYYRAMIGPFGTPDQASDFCNALKSAGGTCVIQRN